MVSSELAMKATWDADTMSLRAPTLAKAKKIDDPLG
jgi:hypothetical protein